MGIDSTFGKAFAKSQLSTDGGLPRKGKVFISVRDKDKSAVLKIAQALVQLGFQLLATRGTAEYLRGAGLAVETVLKYKEGRPHIVDHIKNGEIALVINTPEGKASQHDSYYIRRNALVYKLPYCTTIAGAWAATQGIKAILEGQLEVISLQEYHRASITANKK
jgi:carbamoyl-phosphate synthase large subunit